MGLDILQCVVVLHDVTEDVYSFLARSFHHKSNQAEPSYQNFLVKNAIFKDKGKTWDFQ